MLECHEVIADTTTEVSSLTVTLDYQQRQKSRAKATTRQGTVIAWFIERGRVLADGEYLKAQDGTLIKVVAANETVSEVCVTDPLALVKAAYHLGNRHVPLQIGDNFLRYQHDHVLDDMIRGLGLLVSCAEKPFHPEPGAYHNHEAHHHDHEHHPHQHDHHHRHHEHTST